MRRSSFLIMSMLAVMSFLCARDLPAAGAAKSLSKQCGATTMTIRCSPVSKDCSKTLLTIGAAKGKVKVPSKPSGMDQYTPVGLACASANHKTYFVVRYGERPMGCAFCEWYHLYTEEGEVLTHSDPAVLTDPTRPPTQQQYPNNKEYNETAKRLGLDEQEIEILR